MEQNTDLQTAKLEMMAKMEKLRKLENNMENKVRKKVTRTKKKICRIHKLKKKT